MAHQLSMPGIKAPPKVTDKLFFAVVPNASAKAQIRRIADSLRSERSLLGKPLPADDLHITIFNTGEGCGLSREWLDMAHAIADRIILEGFKVRFDNVMSFRSQSRVSNQHPLILGASKGVEELNTLYSGFAEFFIQRHCTGIPKTITPHVTILYDNQMIAKRMIEPVEWYVEEFVLLHRRIDQHERLAVLGRWPLH